MPKISIIIPALNEEKHLPKLLESIKKQTFKDFEIIVSDAGSKDNTKKIAKKYGAKIVKGGQPAKGRNNGAKKAVGEFLFFLDADVVLPRSFLKKAHQEMEDRFLDLATCEAYPISKHTIDKVLHNFANIFIKLNQYGSPHAGGFCIIVTKRLFLRIHGFDESLKLAEDHDFVKRASRFRQLRVLDTTSIKISVRRLQKEGRIMLAGKYIYATLYRAFSGEISKDIIDYRFGEFDKEDSSRLKKIEDGLLRLNRKFTKYQKSNVKKYKEQLARFKKEYMKLVRMLKNKQ